DRSGKSQIVLFHEDLPAIKPLVLQLLLLRASHARKRPGERVMRPTFRKLEVKDIGNLERLVVENADGVEPGLMIVDSRLILGQAAIDLVGLAGAGSLVLIALSFSADDGLLLRAMDAYSWCLEYPDTLRRLYPMAKASSRPPRILFIVEKTTDVFLRRIKQLSVLEIDCFAFRHLEVNGAPVVYFDLVERLRKSIVESKSDGPTPAPAPPAKTAEARAKPRTGGPPARAREAPRRVVHARRVACAGPRAQAGRSAQDRRRGASACRAGCSGRRGTTTRDADRCAADHGRSSRGGAPHCRRSPDGVGGRVSDGEA